ncbi:MAG: ABC transporter substrate-binding protein [Gulosibacter sp.]|uniref:ABC transporter substrate-binding protein n=1 Tax=Gulosibacter sp. TaxID=2817531 RepID=UPI003F8EB6A2
MATTMTVARRFGAVAAALALTTGLAACSGAGTSPANTEGDAGTTAITVLHAPINYEVLYIAQQEGFFDEAGLDVTITPGGTAQDNLGQLAGGSADLAIVSWDAAVTATAEGVPIKLISSNAEISTEIDTSAIMVRADSGITEVADLEGKTIAFNSIGSGGNVPVLQALEDAGVDLESVEQVAIPFASMQAALEGSQVDAVFPSDSFFAQMTGNEEFVEIAHPSREYRGGLGITLWSATDSWLAENAETATKFNEAMAAATEFYNEPENTQVVYEIRAQVSGQPIEDVQGPLVIFDPAIDATVSQATTDALEEFGFVTEPKSVDEILWEEAPRK